MSHTVLIIISRRLADNQDNWLTEYKIPKKYVPPPSNDYFDIENIPPFISGSSTIIPPKPKFECKICGKKADFRKELERHTNTVHKTACSVKGCKKLFWKPNPKFEHRFLEAIARHHADKHSAGNK